MARSRNSSVSGGDENLGVHLKAAAARAIPIRCHERMTK